MSGRAAGSRPAAIDSARAGRAFSLDPDRVHKENRADQRAIVQALPVFARAGARSRGRGCLIKGTGSPSQVTDRYDMRH